VLRPALDPPDLHAKQGRLMLADSADRPACRRLGPAPASICTPSKDNRQTAAGLPNAWSCRRSHSFAPAGIRRMK
jgi:hypothetical protein